MGTLGEHLTVMFTRLPPAARPLFVPRLVPAVGFITSLTGSIRNLIQARCARNSPSRKRVCPPPRAYRTPSANTGNWESNLWEDRQGDRLAGQGGRRQADPEAGRAVFRRRSRHPAASSIRRRPRRPWCRNGAKFPPPRPPSPSRRSTTSSGTRSRCAISGWGSAGPRRSPSGPSRTNWEASRPRARR